MDTNPEVRRRLTFAQGAMDGMEGWSAWFLNIGTCFALRDLAKLFGESGTRTRATVGFFFIFFRLQDV